MNPLDEETTIGQFLSRRGIDHSRLERLIAQLFRDQYPNLIQAAPAGGSDLGIDIMAIDKNSVATLWAITTEEKPTSKLKSDVEQILRTFSTWRFSGIETIYLCTSRKLTNASFKDIRDKILNLRDELVAKGDTGLKKLELIPVDCDSIANRLADPKYDSLRGELLAEISRAFGLTTTTVSNLDSHQHEAGDGFSFIAEESEASTELWSAQFKTVATIYTGIEDSQDETAILSCVRDASLLAGSIINLGYEARHQASSEVIKKINRLLWPQIIEAWNEDNASSLDAFDPRLVACAMHFNLSITHKIYLTQSKAVNTASAWVAKERQKTLRAKHHSIAFKLTGLLLWQNHQAAQHDKVLSLLKEAFLLLDHETEGREQEWLRLSVAFLYISSIKFGDGDDAYRESLQRGYINATKEGIAPFWRNALHLLISIYDRSAPSQWAELREKYLLGFERFKSTEPTNRAQALTYLELLTRYLQLSDVEPHSLRSRLVSATRDLERQFGRHEKFTTRLVRSQLSVLHSCAPAEVFECFLATEELLRRTLGAFGPFQKSLVKAEFLGAFIFRVLDPKALSGVVNPRRSTIISELLDDKKKTKRLDLYFGISHLEASPRQGRNLREYLRHIGKQLMNEGLNIYSDVLLPHREVPESLRAQAGASYLAFLENASSHYSDLKASVTFWELARGLEQEARDKPRLGRTLGNIYYRHHVRNIKKSLNYRLSFWDQASGLERILSAVDLSRTLFECYIYLESEPSEWRHMVLDRLFSITSEFAQACRHRHFMLCYHGISLILKEEGARELAFLEALGGQVIKLGPPTRSLDAKDYPELVRQVVYSTSFAEFLRSKESDSNMATALVASITSPEIYNLIATFILRRLKDRSDRHSLAPVKRLYDIAIGLAQDQGFYLPKYEFNRVRCDFFEASGHGEYELLIAAISKLHSLSGRFGWARHFLRKEVCDYFWSHRSEEGIQRILDSDTFRERWKILRRAFLAREQDHHWTTA